MDFHSAGHILFPGLLVPPRALIGMQEQIDPIGEYDSDRSLHGTLITYQPAWRSKLYKIALSNTGDGVVPPSMDDLEERTDVTYYAGRWSTKTIQAGATSTTLRRDPVPGSVSGGDPRVVNPVLVPVTVAGRVVSIAAPLAYPLTIYWREVFYCTVISHGGTSTKRFDKSRSWAINLEEREPS